MKRAMKIGYVLSLGLISIGVSRSFASCPEKIDSQLCDILNQVEDTAWVGCMIGMKLQPPDSQVTDPTKDTTSHHTTTSPPAYLIAEVESLFTTYELRYPDTISQYHLAQYPTKTRATVPSLVIDNYGVFIRKRDVLSIGIKDYIGGVWNWSPATITAVAPFLRNDLKSPYQGKFFNLNGQRMNGPKYFSGPFLKFRE